MHLVCSRDAYNTNDPKVASRSWPGSHIMWSCSDFDKVAWSYILRRIWDNLSVMSVFPCGEPVNDTPMITHMFRFFVESVGWHEDMMMMMNSAFISRNKQMA